MTDYRKWAERHGERPRRDGPGVCRSYDNFFQKICTFLKK